jgi:putative ABC transport system permease protein
VRLVPLQETVVGNARQSLILLLGAVGLVLLIGCVNVANLLLARASARGREMAVRQALGAARKRLMSQLLVEGLLLSLVGGIAGLAILFCTKGFLVRLVPDSLPRLNNISISWPVLLFALLTTIAAGVIFGLAPALYIGRPDLTRVFKQEGRGSTGSGEQVRTRRVLVITEFALSLVLMIAAGLLLRSFADLLNVRPGFDPRGVMAVSTWLPVPNDPDTDIYRTAALEAPFVREVIRRSKTLPGVQEVAVGDLAAFPLGHSPNDRNPHLMVVEGQETQGKQSPLVDAVEVTPEYFHLLAITLLRGRLFSEADNEKAPSVAVINESFARAYWPNADPLGKHIKLDNARGSSGNPPWTTVVGVITDARTESLAEATAPQVYLNLYQKHPKDLAIFLRGRLDPATTPVELRREVQIGRAHV